MQDATKRPPRKPSPKPEVILTVRHMGPPADDPERVNRAMSYLADCIIRSATRRLAAAKASGSESEAAS